MINPITNLNFSFSGLKTSVLYFLRSAQEKDSDFIKKNLYDLCASIQAAIVSVLVEKVKTAVKQTGLKQVVLGGGVSANSGLRIALENFDVELFLPPLPYTTDNAAMIAMAGYLKFKKGLLADLASEPKARTSI